MATLVDILQYRLDLDTKGFTGNAGTADLAVNRLAGSIGGVLTGALGGLAAAFGAVKLGEFLKDATLTAARTEVLGTALSQVGKNAGISQGQLTLLEEQVKSLGITTQEARTSIIRFIQSGLPLEKIAKLARLAQDSAVVSGINSSEALDRLMRGIQTGQTELLRSAGVFISIEQSIRSFAKTAGVSTDSITDLQRQTAILNAVLAQSEKLAGNYEAAMGDVGKQLTSQPRLWEELANTIGTIFLPILESLVESSERAAKGLTSILTPDAIEGARSALGKGDVNARQEALVALLEKRARITETIARNEALINQLNLSAQNSPLSGINFLAADYAKGVTALLKSQLEEIQNLVEGFRAKTLEGIPKMLSQHQLDAAAQDALEERRAKREEERAKRAAERGKELAKTITIGGDLAEGMDKAWAEILSGLELIPLQFDYSKLDFDIKAIREKIALGLEQAKLSPYGRTKDKEELFDIRGIQEDLRRAADKAREDFERAFRGAGQIASVVFRNLAGEMAGVFDNILGSFYDLATGNIFGGLAGILDTALGFLTSSTNEMVKSSYEIIRSQRSLIEAISDWRDSILGLTPAESDQSKADARRAVDLLDRGRTPRPGEIAQAREILSGMGFDVAGLSWQQLLELARGILAGVTEFNEKFEELKNADTEAERRNLASGARNLEEFQFFMEGFTTLFGISVEEQARLWEDFLSRYGNQLSPEDFLYVTGEINRLKQQDSAGPTQVERSIARVSERQADSLIAGLNTLDLHLVNGLTAITEYLQQMLNLGQNMAAGTAGVGGNYNVEINNYFSGGNQAEIESTVSKAVEKGLRAVGGTRIGSR